MANFVNSKDVSKSLAFSSGFKSDARKPLIPVTLMNKWKIGKGSHVQVASFLVKTIALEAVRRISKARYPFFWTGLQALQVLCYPPLNWIQRWNPFAVFIKGMQMLSRPLLVLSIVDAFSDHADCGNSVNENTDDSNSIDDSQVVFDSHAGSLSLQCNNDMGIVDESPQGLLSTEWLHSLCQELENHGITLPERINKEELQRFYVAANGDLPSLVLSVKKTIRWRETYRFLSREELEVWSNMIFWHGSDMKHRPCLFIRLGMACISLRSLDKPQFVQAVVTQVEHGVLYLSDGEDSRITVVVDCQGLSPLKIPMQMMRHCCNLLQDHFPNVLGCLIVIRLPPVVRVIAQAFIQVLKPVTKQKLIIEGEAYQKVLSDGFQNFPSYLGGLCACTRCIKLKADSIQPSVDSHNSISGTVPKITNSDVLPSVELAYPCAIIVEESCERTFRSAIVGILIILVLIAFLEGIYDPASRPVLPP